MDIHCIVDYPDRRLADIDTIDLVYFRGSPTIEFWSGALMILGVKGTFNEFFVSLCQSLFLSKKSTVPYSWDCHEVKEQDRGARKCGGLI